MSRKYPDAWEGTANERTLTCSSHGKLSWSGQVLCVGCDAVWHLNVDNPPTEDGRCTCGAELVGKGGTARAICLRCYADLKIAGQKMSKGGSA